MNKRFLVILALTLCVGAFLFPMTAYAVSDTTPPTLSAWINGDTLHVEASDDMSGVDAVYIDGTRVNYRVDGAFDVPLSDYAGSGEYISVYAVDFSGNKSDAVQLKNPYYVAPVSTPTATSTPVATQTAASTTSTKSTAASATSSTEAPVSTDVPSESPETEAESTESAVEEEASPFTPDGTGTVEDNVTEQNGKEFFTIITADGNEFFLIIDRERSTDNVYLLNAVTEDDLMSLAKKSDDSGTSESAVSTPETSTQTPETTPESTPEPDAENSETSGSNAGAILIILLVVLGVGGAGYYFKILKPKRQGSDIDDDYDDEDDDYDGESDYPDDSEDDYAYHDEDVSADMTDEE